jgi:hypothetical protein
LFFGWTVPLPNMDIERAVLLTVVCSWFSGGILFPAKL